ncbi:MAG: SRPBCC family protein [Rhodanobacteraceae bacterium]
MSPSTNRIEKQVQLKASRERVWQAISDSSRFGTWFGVDFDGPFVEGEKLTGRIVPTRVDEEVAAMQTPYEGTPFEWQVEKIEPMRRISFRWHPFGVDKRIDYSREPMTLIVFELHDTPDGILLTVTESGFDKLPPERRARAFAANEGGWTHQMKLIGKYLASPDYA